MMTEAIKADLDINADLDENYFGTLDVDDRHATIKPTGLVVGGDDEGLIQSNVELEHQPKHTGRSWKDYLWNGSITYRKTSRASSTASRYADGGNSKVTRDTSVGNKNTKVQDERECRSPQRALTLQSEHSDSESRTSSTSVTSWTMRLFAGNPQAGREIAKESTPRIRAATTGGGRKSSRASSEALGRPPPTSAKAALMKMNNIGVGSPPRRKIVPPLNLNSNGAIRGKAQTSNSQISTSPGPRNTATNLGPVEMDTILPFDSRPPTQTQSNNNDDSAEYLTDRFGFIYDQRRRKREADAFTSRLKKNVGKRGGSVDITKVPDTAGLGDITTTLSLIRPGTPASTDEKSDEKSAKRWQDYLKVATFPTELLLHTPSTKPLISVPSADPQTPPRRPAPLSDSRGSLPSSSLNPEPLASPITANNAEIAKPSASDSAAQAIPITIEVEPVKMLLQQLNELHDSLQRERTVKWNEFLRKVRAEQKKERESAPSINSRSRKAMPEMTLTDGEMIGVAGLGNKGKVGRAKWNELRQLVLAGIPVAYRAKIWAECSGASTLRVPGYYDDLVSHGDDDPTILAQIKMDINRTLTDNIFFRKGPGVAKLNEVLIAYSRRNPEVGYCQGMNLITASLLLIMPSAEDAFWVLTSMIESILPPHYYDHSLLTSRADQQVLRQYVAELLPRLSVHLDELGIELEALTFQWFLSVFTDCLSAEALYRVWDVVLCFNDGSTFLFQVALALLKLNEGALLECETAAGVYSYIGHEMTGHAISIDGLVNASDALRKVVRRSEVEEKRQKAVDIERERGRAGSTRSAIGSRNASRSRGFKELTSVDAKILREE